MEFSENTADMWYCQLFKIQHEFFIGQIIKIELFRIRTVKQQNIWPLLIDGDRKPLRKSVAYRWVLLIHGVAYSG